MRANRVAGVVLLMVACLMKTPAFAHPPTREELVGAWTLSSIELRGRAGVLPDPFYQPGSVGLIIYDSSGRMSVQISAPRRRTLAGGRKAAASAKAAAFDSYYAYIGTWTYDAAASAVIHHVESALLPAEIGVDYTQKVSVEGNRLTFTNGDSIDGEPATRIKVWERATLSRP